MGFSRDELRETGDGPAPRADSASSVGGGGSAYLRLRSMCVMRVLSLLHVLIRSGAWICVVSVNVRKSCAVIGLLLNRGCRGCEQAVSVEAGSMEVKRKTATSTGWGSVPPDDVLGEPSVGSTWDSLPNDSQSRSAVSEDGFSAISYYIKNNFWKCSGFDLISKLLKVLSPFSYVPLPDAEFFKEYYDYGHGGHMCAEFSKSPSEGDLVVFNPLTGNMTALPPLLQPRNPVLVHSVDSAENSYKLILAGSSAASNEHPSRKMEVFDSSKSKWKEVCDLRGPAFGLNEHQAGVCLNGKLFFISFLESGGRGVVALDLHEEKRVSDLTVLILWSSYSSILQLVESDGKLLLFSEPENDHRIHELEFQNPKAGVSTPRWRSFVKVKKSGGRGLQVYPERTCFGFGEEKLRIFNPRRKKLLFVLLMLYLIAALPSGAFAEDQSINCPSSTWIPSNAWEGVDFAKKSAGTLLFGSTAFVLARTGFGIFRWLRARRTGDLSHIDRGLKASPVPKKGDPVFAIPEKLPCM